MYVDVCVDKFSWIGRTYLNWAKSFWNGLERYLFRIWCCCLIPLTLWSIFWVVTINMVIVGFLFFVWTSHLMFRASAELDLVSVESLYNQDSMLKVKELIRLKVVNTLDSLLRSYNFLLTASFGLEIVLEIKCEIVTTWICCLGCQRMVWNMVRQFPSMWKKEGWGQEQA